MYGFLYRSLRLSVRRGIGGCSRIPISTPIEYSTLYYTVMALKPCESPTARTVYGPLTARKNTSSPNAAGLGNPFACLGIASARPSPCLRRPAERRVVDESLALAAFAALAGGRDCLRLEDLRGKLWQPLGLNLRQLSHVEFGREEQLVEEDALNTPLEKRRARVDGDRLLGREREVLAARLPLCRVEKERGGEAAAQGA